jgi:hypothetical protein
VPLLETLEERCLLAGDFRTIDGSGNNVLHPDWGMAGTDLLRTTDGYGDRISTPAGANRPSPRLLSDVLNNQKMHDVPNDRFMSDMVYFWGQFIDHDMDLTLDNLNPDGTGVEPLNIPVPTGDPVFDPQRTGTQVIDFNRSQYDPATGTDPSNPRQQTTLVTAFLDGSMIYGSDPVRADALRTHVGGRLKTSPGDMLPYNNATYFGDLAPLPNENQGPYPDDQLFVAGDVRANENIEITALQTLCLREHNWWADQIHTAHPNLDDETIYQLARQIVGAEIQSITYNEFLPALLGPYTPPPYTGYKPDINPGISNEFSTAAYRFGHSMLDNTVDRLTDTGQTIPEGSVDLKYAFFNPALLNPALPNHEGDIDPILKGGASGDAQEVDPMVVQDVRNFLFGPPGAGGFDLVSLDIQRGRDHGLPDYNTAREAYGLQPYGDIRLITENVSLRTRLKELYGSVNNIDLFEGLLAEDHLPGASVGPLLKAILVDQFTRLRDGDRYWFERIFSGAQLQALENTTLADIIRRNTSLTHLQDNVFFFQVGISGTVFDDLNNDGHWDDGDPGQTGVTVLLEDPNGRVVGETQTDDAGAYSFTNDDIPELGTYRIRVEVPPGYDQTTPDPEDIQLTQAMTVDQVNFGVHQVSPSLVGVVPLAGGTSGQFALDAGVQTGRSVSGNAALLPAQVAQTDESPRRTAELSQDGPATATGSHPTVKTDILQGSPSQEGTLSTEAAAGGIPS